MKDESTRKILLGVCGCTQAQVLPHLIGEIQKLDLSTKKIDIIVVATPAALKFIDAEKIKSMVGRQVFVKHTDMTAEFDVPHIQLAKWCEICVIYPASANTIAKCAHGITDTLLTNIVLAMKSPVYFAPIMNEAMAANLATQDNLKKLKKWGYRFVPKEKGNVFVHATKSWVEKDYCTESSVLRTIRKIFARKV